MPHCELKWEILVKHTEIDRSTGAVTYSEPTSKLSRQRLKLIKKEQNYE